jgi:hypothetical protein
MTGVTWALGRAETTLDSAPTMLSNLKLNNDSLLHWCFGMIVEWALSGLTLGIPIHLAFGVRTSSIALFVAVQCAVQVAMSP